MFLSRPEAPQPREREIPLSSSLFSRSLSQPSIAYFHRLYTLQKSSGAKNPYTPKDSLLRYWNRKISNNLPAPTFFISKASPFTATQLAKPHQTPKPKRYLFQSPILLFVRQLILFLQRFLFLFVRQLILSPFNDFFSRNHVSTLKSYLRTPINFVVKLTKLKTFLQKYLFNRILIVSVHLNMRKQSTEQFPVAYDVVSYRNSQNLSFIISFPFVISFYKPRILLRTMLFPISSHHFCLTAGQLTFCYYFPHLISFFLSTMSPLFLPPFFFFLFSVLPPTTQAQQKQQEITSFNSSNSPWTPDQSRILVSPNSTFAAGFRTLPNSEHLFAVWFKNISTNTNNNIVWSLKSTPRSTLLITPSGELFFNGSTGKNLWLPTPPTTPNNNNPSLRLKDDGSLVYGNWSSFSFPTATNTILPNQPFKDLTSTNGKFMFNHNSTNLAFNSSVYWTTEKTIVGLDSNGNLITRDSNPLVPSDLGEGSKLRRLTLDNDGNLRAYSFDSGRNRWIVVWQAIQELCKIHGTCGPNFVCMSNGSNSTSCVCPPGFQEKGTSDKTCEPKKTFTRNTLDGSKFIRLDYVNYSGGSNPVDIKAPNYTKCEAGCYANPNCLGFGFKYDGKQYCVHQLDRLLYGYWSPGTEAAMFLRVPKSEPEDTQFTGMTSMLDTSCPVRIILPVPPKESKAATRNIAIICTLFAIELITGVLAFSAFLRKYIKYRDMAQTLGLELLPAGGPKRFSYAELKAATNDFSNIVGRGGFGVVYRGELPDHRIIAVKRLKDAGGGETEFWAEVTIIARMHHLNLVRMWGFCAEKSTRMLVYEYIPNGSLDKFLFPAVLRAPADSEVSTAMGIDSAAVLPFQPRPILDWNIRYRIALGVARAIAYLHEECLEWVLHCDIKPENILLEDDFCPKVSDFGLAKLAKKEDMVSMSRIRGTRGYLAPEWVKSEPITAKADVYSFGMVLLEIISGIRNFDFRRSSLDSEEWYFPRWAFEKVYKEMNVEDILDRRILDSFDREQHYGMVDRMVKTAMWCLQDRAEARPSMGKVAKMLEGTVEIMEPGKPTIFYLGEE